MDQPPIKRPVLPDLAKLAATMEQTISNLRKIPPTSRRTWPYYNENAAAEMLEHIREVLQTGRALLLPSRGVKAATLMAKWNQSMAWIRENDEENAPLIERVRCERVGELGIRILPDAQFVQIASSEWRDELRKFIDESEHGDKFERHLPLTADDTDYVHSQLIGVEHLFLTNITATSIILIRYDGKPIT